MSVSSWITPASEFTPETDVKYGQPKKLENGSTSIKVLNSKTNKPLYISLPLFFTWGISEYVSPEGKVSYSLSLQFPSDEYASDETRTILKNLLEFQDKLKADALINSRQWLGAPHKSPDVIDALFTPMIKYRKDRETGEIDYNSNPTLRAKVPFWEGKFNCEIYDVNGNKLFPLSDAQLADYERNGVTPPTPCDIVPKATRTAPILMCGGIWTAAGKFGATWKYVQGVVKPQESLYGKCHVVLSDVDRNQLLTESNTDNTTANPDNVGLTVTEDSDDESDDEVENEQVPPAEAQPAPPAQVQESSDLESEDEPEPVVEKPKPKKVVKKKIVKKKVVKRKKKADDE